MNDDIDDDMDDYPRMDGTVVTNNALKNPRSWIKIHEQQFGHPHFLARKQDFKISGNARM